MPLRWKIDPDDRIVVVVADGQVCRAEVDRMLDDMVTAGALGYRKLFDGASGETAMSPMELLSLGIRMRSFHNQGPMGPLAVIVPAEKWGIIARVLGMLATARRPMRIFNDAPGAYRWLRSRDAVGRR